MIGRKPEDGDDELLTGGDVKLFRSGVGSLAYAAIDRYDVQLEADRLAKLMSSPTCGGMVALRRLVRYMVGTHGYEVKMPTSCSKGREPPDISPHHRRRLPDAWL